MSDTMGILLFFAMSIVYVLGSAFVDALRCARVDTNARHAQQICVPTRRTPQHHRGSGIRSGLFVGRHRVTS